MKNIFYKKNEMGSGPSMTWYPSLLMLGGYEKCLLCSLRGHTGTGDI